MGLCLYFRALSVSHKGRGYRLYSFVVHHFVEMSCICLPFLHLCTPLFWDGSVHSSFHELIGPCTLFAIFCCLVTVRFWTPTLLTERLCSGMSVLPFTWLRVAFLFVGVVGSVCVPLTTLTPWKASIGRESDLILSSVVYAGIDVFFPDVNLSSKLCTTASI